LLTRTSNMNDGRRVMIIVAVAVIIIGIATASIVMATSISSGRNNTLSDKSSNVTYLTVDIGATAACAGPTGYVPCFGWQRNQAVVFNCVQQAESSSGCTQQVVSKTNPVYRFQINIWFDQGTNHNTTSPNCYWQSSGDVAQYHSYCVQIGATNFIVTQPQPVVPF